MNDYQEKLQEEQTEQKPKRKKKTIQERLDRALELKAKTDKQLAAIQSAWMVIISKLKSSKLKHVLK